MRADVKPELLSWATRRSRIDPETLAARFPQLDAWQRGAKKPTLKQLEAFARATHTPIGFLFLHEPPVDRVPIPDFRTRRDRPLAQPSPDLLEVVYQCQQRQDWYREFAQWVGEGARAFVGSVTMNDPVVEVAARIRTALEIDLEERRELSTWSEALRRLIEQADASGVLVMVSGVVGSDNTRKLDPEEFRGFALADPIAPLVFVNGADTKAAQMFTITHELAHVWLGKTALSNPAINRSAPNDVEKWCNDVAAEVLVPMDSLVTELDASAELESELQRLARVFKVSTLVVLRRIFDAGKLSRQRLSEIYQVELARLNAHSAGGGGDFYLTLGARASKRFARAVVVSALEGRASFSEAFRLLGFRKMSTFNELGRQLGVIA